MDKGARLKLARRVTGGILTAVARAISLELRKGPLSEVIGNRCTAGEER